MQRIAGKSKLSRAVFLVMLNVGVVSLVSCAAEPPVVLPVNSAVTVLEAPVANPFIAPANCHFQGHVLVRTVDRFKPKDLGLTPAEVTELKDKTAQLNANSVVIQSNQLLHRHDGMFVHAVDAQAYLCDTSSSY